MGELRINAPRTDDVTGIGGNACIPSSDGHVDIGSPENGSFRLWGSGIGSWWVENGTDHCCPGCTTTDLKRSVKIYLYHQRNYEGYVGYVLFGHVRSPLADGGRNYAPSGDLIGYTPKDDCTDNCYDRTHLHTEAEPAPGVTLSVLVSYLQSLTAGSTAVYKWTYP
jgi:hypothetical protein